MFKSRSRKRRKKNPSRRRRTKSRRRNPSFRAKRRSSSKRRRNPVFRAKRRSSSKRRRNPVFSSRRRSSSRRRRNPAFASSLRAGFDPKFIMNAVLTSGGLIAGTKSASLIANLPVVGSAGRFLGAINLVLGGVLAGLTRNPHLKSLAVGFAAGGAYNLIASNVSALGLTAMSGDEFLGVEVNGEQPLVALGGVEVSGEDSYVLMGADANGSWGGKW